MPSRCSTTIADRDAEILGLKQAATQNADLGLGFGDVQQETIAALKANVVRLEAKLREGKENYAGVCLCLCVCVCVCVYVCVTSLGAPKSERPRPRSSDIKQGREERSVRERD